MARASSLMRSSAIMGAGSMVSRILGLARTMLLVYAIGQNTDAGDAFGAANGLPNMIYMLVAGGALNAVLVPQIVKATKAGDGEDYLNRLVTLAILILSGLTITVVVATPLLIQVLVNDKASDEMLNLAIGFGYIALPQVLFYGLYTVFGQILNAKNNFGPYMWAPVANNVVAISGLLLFIKLYGSGNSADNLHKAGDWTAQMIWLLAGTATLGIMVQAAVLVPALRHIGFTYTPQFRNMLAGMGSAGQVAGWTIAAVVIGQVISALVIHAATSVSSRQGDDLSTAGYNAYQNSYLLFMLPHGIIVVSLVTALFTRMSTSAAQADKAAVARDASMALRVIGLVMVLATTGLVALGDPIAMILIGNSVQAHSLARVVAVMALGLVFFSSNYALQRVFYAFEDGKRPFLAQLPSFAITATATLIASRVSPDQVVVTIAAGMALGYAAGLVAAWWMSRAHIEGTNPPRVLWVWVRAGAAGFLAGVIGYLLITHPLEAWWQTRMGAVAAVAVAGPVVVAVYLCALWLQRVSELRTMVGLIKRRTGRT